MTLIDEAKAMRREQIEVNHAVMDGEPVIRGTRVRSNWCCAS
jgi:uncharacterized protein (DUF433 family)